MGYALPALPASVATGMVGWMAATKRRVIGDGGPRSDCVVNISGEGDNIIRGGGIAIALLIRRLL